MFISPVCTIHLTLFFLCLLSEAHLGVVYGLLSKRRMQFVSDSVDEGSQIYTISGFLPAASSFGLAAALHNSTSGVATAQMAFDHWAIHPVDPYRQPTAEELEELGEGEIDALPNAARDFMNGVRKRKV